MDRSVDGLVGGVRLSAGGLFTVGKQLIPSVLIKLSFCNQLHYMGFNLQLVGTMATYLVISKHDGRQQLMDPHFCSHFIISIDRHNRLTI